MSITSWELYWILQLDKLRDVCETIAIIGVNALVMSGVALLVTTLIYPSDVDMRAVKLLKSAFACICALLVASTLIVAFTPTTKQMVAIKVLPAIINSEFVRQGIPRELNDIYTMAKEYMKEKLVAGDEE